MALLLGACCVCRGIRAEPAQNFAPIAQTNVRMEARLAIVGGGTASARNSLVPLLEGQLHGMGLSLVEQEPAGSVLEWVTAATKEKNALLAIVLDTNTERGWRLVVVDVARRRAIARTLPGGVQQDAASAEAVASIVISAASALREGLEVASAPVSAVVGDAPSPTDEPPVRPLHEPTHSESDRGLVVHGAVDAALASFGKNATAGAALALGLGWRDRWPVTIHSAFGEFRVNRALVGAALGPVFHAGGGSLSPEIGVLVERLRRFGTQPVQGVFSNQAEPLYRVGGLVELRVRRRLFRPLSLELVAGAAYLGRSVQFSARNGDRYPFLEISPVMGFAQLGIDIATE